MRAAALLLAITLTAGAAFADNQRWQPPLTQGEWGRFEGEIVAKFQADGRIMQVVTPFTYIDKNGKHWPVPAGATTDGASIPQALWLAFPPFSGPYRAAAVMHDYYCEAKSRPWRDTHRAFYAALRASGVPHVSAKIMYVAVLRLGPRWQGVRPEPEPVRVALPPPAPSAPAPVAAPAPVPHWGRDTAPLPPRQAKPARAKLSKPKPPPRRVAKATPPKPKPKIIKVAAKTKPAPPWGGLFPARSPAWSPHRPGAAQF